MTPAAARQSGGGDVLGATVGSADIGSTDTALSPSGGGSSPTTPAPSSDVSGATKVAAVKGTPISLALAIFALLLALLAAAGLRRFATAVLQPATVTTCHLESQRE